MTTRTRLTTAALLCVVPLGFASSAPLAGGTIGFRYYPGFCSLAPGGALRCPSDPAVPVAMSDNLVAQAPIRAFLVLAAIAFAVCAGRVRTEATRQLARAGCAAIGVGVALAAGNGSARIVLCLVGALVLVVPLVWGRPRESGRFGMPGRARVE